MMKKFLFSFLAIMGIMAIEALVIFIALSSFRNPDSIILPIIILTFVFFLIAFILIMPIIWTFKPKPGTKVIPKSEIKKEILEINSFNGPVQVIEKKGKIIITWNYADAKWWEILAKSGLKKVYQLHIKLNDKNKTAKIAEVYKSVFWRVSPQRMILIGGWFRGISANYEQAVAYGIKENFDIGKIYDYKFIPAKIRNPIMTLLLEDGWKIKVSFI